MQTAPSIYLTPHAYLKATPGKVVSKAKKPGKAEESDSSIYILHVTV